MEISGAKTLSSRKLHTTEEDLFLPSLQKSGRKDEVDCRDLDQRKTLQTLQPVTKNPDENDEFEKQRTAAIAEVAKAKEVFKLLLYVF